MAISTNPKSTIYPNLYDNTGLQSQKGSNFSSKQLVPSGFNGMMLVMVLYLYSDHYWDGENSMKIK